MAEGEWAVDPLRHDIDEKTQSVPPLEAGTGAPGDPREINTGYPPVRQPGWNQVDEARRGMARREDEGGGDGGRGDVPG